MAPGRSLKTLVSRRRRSEGDDYDDDSVTMADDTQSELSVASDLDEGADADADASDMSDTDTTEPMLHDSKSLERPSGESKNGGARAKRRRKPKKTAALEQSRAPDVEHSGNAASVANGFTKTAAAAAATTATDEPNTDLEDMPLQDSNTSESQSGTGRKTNAAVVAVADRRRREHEEYKKKRDSDPTFIPNRGGFFMHDARNSDQRGFPHGGRGRGRGRGLVGAPFAPGPQLTQAESATDANWKHDLHETINEPDNLSKPSDSLHDTAAAVDQGARGGAPVSAHAPARPLNFSRTTQIGKVQIRVHLPGSKAPILFSDVPVKSHARLPDHRPPLRRDKPVRISLPDAAPRYRFPSSERSFIFIPRAQRPNQQGFGRARGSFGAYGAGVGGPASRRTSMYGGSVYSPSASMSRRSSLAREVPRDLAFSPTGSYIGRPQQQPGRPVVRLPHRSSNASPASSITPYGRGQPYPLPQKPAVEHWAEPATMYQPRPRKTISVTGIESPAGMSLHAPQQQDQQPFHNQIPLHMGENGVASHQAPHDLAQQPYYTHSYPYQGGASTGTPLSNIPERAIHAQPFQPVPAFYPQYPTQGYYYPAQAPQYHSMPMYAPSVQPGFNMVDGNTAAGPVVQADASHAQPGTVAYETNGMVYYQDAAQPAQYPQQDGYYQAPVYGMGGMMTPGPEGGYYYPHAGALYYPQA